MSIIDGNKIEEPEFLASSFCSRDGRLFVWQNDIYRAITFERTPFFERLFDDGVIDHLITDGYIVQSTLVDIQVPGFGLVVKHQKIPYVTYPNEWCDQAIKDAALFLLDFNLELLNFGLMTHDAHPWNILFRGTAPIFIDLGSLKPVEDTLLNDWIEEFSKFFLRPLRLLTTGDTRIARLCMQDWQFGEGGVSKEDYIRLTEQNLAEKYWSTQVEYVREVTPDAVRAPYRVTRRLFQRLRSNTAAKSSNNVEGDPHRMVLEDLKKQVMSNELSEDLGWDYYQELFTFPAFSDSADWSPKHQAVADFLRSTNPATVLDIGSNRGWYALYAASQGANVIALEMDELHASILFRDAKTRDLLVQPLVVDFLWPSPGYGLLNFREPAVERLRSDMVFALALVHHLTFRQALQFDHIVEGFSKFSKRWLLTEFIALDDEHLSKWRKNDLDWYTLNNFLDSLGHSYRILGMAESNPPTRTLIMCERI